MCSPQCIQLAHALLQHRNVVMQAVELFHVGDRHLAEACLQAHVLRLV